MVVKKEYTTKIISENPREGKGIIEGYRYLDSHDLTNSLKGFYINELLPNSEVGYHEHLVDEEIYLILDGEGIVNDNGIEEKVEAGTLIYTKKGQGHSLKNIGDKALKFAAFIVEV
jgi:mannose-6-phosphate isomerase-like protein (cupin superfamily)